MALSSSQPAVTLKSPFEKNGGSNTVIKEIAGDEGAKGGDTLERERVAKEKEKLGHRRVDHDTGEVSYKKVPTDALMGAIQLGIANSIGSLAMTPERDLLMHDFEIIEHFSFPSDGSQTTPSHQYGDFRFKSYAPIAFRYFRDLFSIKPANFLRSICFEPLKELSNSGASGSIFYVSSDDQFIIKTVQHKEAEFLQKLLPGYYMNLNQNPLTLLPKFFGLFCYQSHGKNIRLLVMNNLLPQTIRMHLKYDLKGSTYKRAASKNERAKSSPTLKDLDFQVDYPEGMYLEAVTYDNLMMTINRDCLVKSILYGEITDVLDVLESFKIMDYSLLIGIHNIDRTQREVHSELPNINNLELELQQTEDIATNPDDVQLSMADKSTDAHEKKIVKVDRSHRQKSILNTLENIQSTSLPIDIDEGYPEGGVPARNVLGERLLLFLGVIDILQDYRLMKKLEHTWKSVLHDGDSISVHKPGFYAHRFQEFMKGSVFRKIPSLDLPEIKGPHRRFRTFVHSLIALKHSPNKAKRHRSSSTTEQEKLQKQQHEWRHRTGTGLVTRLDVVPASKTDNADETVKFRPIPLHLDRQLTLSGRTSHFYEGDSATPSMETKKERKVERLFASTLTSTPNSRLKPTPQRVSNDEAVDSTHL